MPRDHPVLVSESDQLLDSGNGNECLHVVPPEHLAGIEGLVRAINAEFVAEDVPSVHDHGQELALGGSGMGPKCGPMYPASAIVLPRNASRTWTYQRHVRLYVDQVVALRAVFDQPARDVVVEQHGEVVSQGKAVGTRRDALGDGHRGMARVVDHDPVTRREVPDVLDDLRNVFGPFVREGTKQMSLTNATAQSPIECSVDR